MRTKIGIGALILVALSFVVLWDDKPKEVLNTVPMAVLADTTTPTSSPSLAAPEEPEEELPTIKRSEVPDDSPLGGGGGKDGNYELALIDGESIEVPASLIYSDDIVPLQIKSAAELDEIISTPWARASKDEFEYWKEQMMIRIKEGVSDFGSIARRYLPDDMIVHYYEVDIDGDGGKEKLITLCGVGGNSCSDYVEIIKNNKVIFSAELNGDGAGSGGGITPAKEGGFYIDWTEDKSFYNEKGEWTGLCCGTSYNKTLFQFKNGKLTPIKQWKIPHAWKKIIEG